MKKYIKEIQAPVIMSTLILVFMVSALVFAGSQLVVKAEPESENSTNPVTNQTVEIVKGLQTGNETKQPEPEKPVEEKPKEETPAPAPVVPEQEPEVEDVTAQETTEAPVTAPVTNADDGSLPTTGPAETLMVVVAIIASTVVGRRFFKSRIELRNSALNAK